MTRRFSGSFVALAVAALMIATAPAQDADSNIDPSASFAWGENIGWLNWNPDAGSGAGYMPAATPPPIIGETNLGGFLWGENVGWINLGSGFPTDGVTYTNTSAGDFGVNLDVSGNLTGYAWGENIGWVNFGWDGTLLDPDRPQLDLVAATMSGYAWGENVGWVNLDGSSTGGSTAQVGVALPTVDQIIDGIIARTDVPLFSDRNADATVNAADVVTRRNELP